MEKKSADIDPNIVQSLASVGMEPDQLIAAAFKELAGNAEKHYIRSTFKG